MTALEATSDRAAAFDTFLEAAWNDHADDAEGVAQRLCQSLHMITSPDAIAPYARIVTHVYGEHLGRWQPGVELLASLRNVAAWDGLPAHVSAVARGQAVLRYCSGASDALDDFSAADRATVLATVASAFAGLKTYASAIAAYKDALTSAEGGFPAGSPAQRALAAGGNNLAVALEEKPDRNALETQGMLTAAAGGLKYWAIAGTWLETERAHYRLSTCLRSAGNFVDAADHARLCLALCTENSAPPFEIFFGSAALALAQRDAGQHEAFVEARTQALACHDAVAPDEQRWCVTVLQAMGQ